MERRRLLIGVTSASFRMDRRTAALATWARPLPSYQGQVELAFLIGHEYALAPVRRGHNLFVPCPDDPGHMTVKIRSFLLWALRYYDFDYLLKCDDDTYVDIKRVLAIPPGRQYSGAQVGYVQHRDELVGFASGGAGYLLSREAVHQLTHQLLDRAYCEDLIVGQALARGGIYLEPDDRFRPTSDWGPLPDNDLLTSHGGPAEQLYIRHRLRYPEAHQLRSP